MINVGRNNFFRIKVLKIETVKSCCLKIICDKQTVQLNLSVTDKFYLRERLSQFISCKLILCS